MPNDLPLSTPSQPEPLAAPVPAVTTEVPPVSTLNQAQSGSASTISAPVSTPSQPAAPSPKPSLWRRWWLWLVLLIIIGGLGGGIWWAIQTFNNRVTTDHAEHMEMSPSVHAIMHVRQKLVIGTDDTYQPMEYLDASGTNRIGYDIDLSKAIAQELNVPVEFINVDFDSIFAPENLGKSNTLTQGKVDMLIDSVTITSQRQKYYLFSQPYLKVGQVALTLKTNTTIQTKNDLKGKRLSVASSTSNETLAMTLTDDKNILRFAKPEDQAEAVLSGKADAMLLDLTNAQGIVADHPELKIATDPMTDESYGVVIAKDKSDLLDQVNQILNTLKQHGVLESLQQKWFE